MKSLERGCFVTEESIARFGMFLHLEERAGATVSEYVHAVREFAAWMGNREVTKDKVAEWKEMLRQEGKAAVTINGMLAALHGSLA